MKLFTTLILSLTLVSLAVAQQPGGPSVQVQGRRGSVNLGITPDGRAEVNATGQRGSVRMQAPASNWQMPDGAGSHNDVTVERSPDGKTYYRTRNGNITIDDATIQQWFNTRGR